MPNVESAPKRNAGDQVKEAEVERILRAFKKNPYDVLDIPAFATESEVKKTYRKKSLMIHPDKFKHDQGPEAFDLLKKAEGQLSDENERGKIDSIMKYARTLVLKEALGSGYSTKVEDDDPRIIGMKPPYQTQLRLKARQLIIEDSMDEKKRASMVATNEAEERARKEAEVANRKRKQEKQKQWEEGREVRVEGWRDYMHKTKQRKLNKAKKGLNTLG